MIHQVFITELSAILVVVVYAVPRLDAEERGVLAVRCPDANARSVEADCDCRTRCLRVENLYLAQLTLVDDNRVVLEALLIESPKSAVASLQFVAVVGDASVVIAVDALNLVAAVEAQTALDRLALLHSRQVECGVSANLEVYLACVGVMNMPDDVYLVLHELVCCRQHEVVGILSQSVLCV